MVAFYHAELAISRISLRRAVIFLYRCKACNDGPVARLDDVLHEAALAGSHSFLGCLAIQTMSFFLVSFAR
ncbi:MAG: hypothetical protein Q8Q36_01610, partial [bacterium]|nr:hypothetical protein [bacterium]